MNLKVLKSIQTLLRKSKSNVLPIIDCFLIDQEYLYFTNLDVSVRIKHSFSIKVGSLPLILDSSIFLRVMENIKAPYDVFCDENLRIRFDQPHSAIELQSESLLDFPKQIDTKDLQPLFQLTPFEIGVMDLALPFVADDELRPVMQAVCVGESHVVASDAHKLFYKPITVQEPGHVLFSKKVVKLMKLFSTENFKIGKLSQHYYAESNSISISWRSDFGSYPNWKSVIPSPLHNIVFPVDEIISALKTILFAIHPATQNVKINIAGKRMKLSAENIDDALFAEEKVPIVNNESCELEFGFRYSFLLDILKVLKAEGFRQSTLAFTEPTRAFVFQDHMLLMPIMINN